MWALVAGAAAAGRSDHSLLLEVGREDVSIGSEFLQVLLRPEKP